MLVGDLDLVFVHGIDQLEDLLLLLLDLLTLEDKLLCPTDYMYLKVVRARITPK